MNKFSLLVLAACFVFGLQSCKKEKGCTDPTACNYNESAEKDDDSCLYVGGCVDPTAFNYNPDADCDDGTCSYDIVFELYIDYWNESGTNPMITFDAANSSPEVKIDFSESFAGVATGNLANVLINNVRIIDDENINYEITDITAYEWRTDLNDWKEDVEFIMDYSEVQDLSIVMVLDASQSLGGDFATVKNYANDFVSKILQVSSSTQIGIVDFSDDINTLGLSSNQQLLTDYINGIEQGPFTSLYEAMNTGIEMLNSSNADGKTLLTFTDGTDNDSAPTFTSNYVLDLLVNDPNDVVINSFTIGLQGAGGVDVPVLETLAANGGAAEFPNNIEELGTVFDKFSGSIANVYNFTYIRNQQIISESNKVSVKFEIAALPK